MRIWAPDESDSPMTYVPGETLIALVPIGFSKVYGGPAVALLRIGLQAAIPNIEETLVKQYPILEHISSLVLERCRKP